MSQKLLGLVQQHSDEPGSFRALARWQRQALEREQSRLSGEVHDQIGQALTGLKMDVALLRARIRGLHDGAVPAALSDTLTSMSALIDDTIGIARGIARRLRPNLLDDFGLMAALEWYAVEYRQRTAARCALVCDGDDAALPAGVATAAYRIATQLLEVMAHASADIMVRLQMACAEGELRMTLSDHSPAPAARPRQRRSLTVLDAIERAKDAGGRVRIARERAHGRARGGTAIVVTLPLAPLEQPLQAPSEQLEDRST